MNDGAIGLERFELARGEGFEPHTHDDHQLVWASHGMLAVDIARRSWLLPPTLALWVPAGVPHAPRAMRDTVMEGIYLDAGKLAAPWDVPTVVRMLPLAQELVVHLRSALDPPARHRDERVLLDVLAPVRMTVISVPIPADPRARAVADAVLGDPADDRTFAELGRDAGASSRTLLRIFVRETGLAFSTWRTHARLQVATGMLADGRTVSQAAYAVGYSTPSAFVAAFRRATGETPGSYFART